MSRELSSRIADSRRIVITGVGLAAPGAASLAEFRRNLLAGTSGITTLDLRYMGVHPAGVCTFAETRYRKKRENSRGTRAGCIGVYCANEALHDAGIDFSGYDRAATGIYVGVTEHGNVETENEIYQHRPVRLRSRVLVAPPQPAHRGQQPGRRDLAEPRHHRAALHARRGLRRGQRRHHPGRADAAAGRVRPGPVRRRFGEHPHASASSPASTPRARWPSMRIRPRPVGRSTWTATASSWPRAAACSCWNGSTAPGPRGQDLRRDRRLRDEQRRHRLRPALRTPPGRVHANWPCAGPT